VIAGRDSRFRGTQGTSIWQESSKARSPRPAASEEGSGPGSETRTSRRSTSSRIVRDGGVLSGRENARDQGSSSGNPTDVSSGRRCWARRASPKRSIPSPWRSRWGARCTTRPGGGGAFLRRPRSEAQRTPSTSRDDARTNVLRGDIPVCHWDSVDKGSSSMCDNPPELAVESVPGALDIPLPATPRAPGRNSPGPPRSSSSAAPHSAPTTRRASCCRTGSRPGTSPAPCCPVRCWGRSENGGGP